MKKLIFSLVAILVSIGIVSTANARPRHKRHHYHNVVVYKHKHKKVNMVVEQKQEPQIYYSNDDNSAAAFFAKDRARNIVAILNNNKVKTRENFGFIEESIRKGNSLVNKALKYVGATARQLGLPRSLWCADFMNMITHSGNDRTAMSYKHRGQPASYGCVNCVAVITRRGGGHVGVVSGYDKHGNPILISGNHGRKVGVGAYAKSRVVAYRYI
jgi:uncharacterized protein (TIGR02594 family)